MKIFFSAGEPSGDQHAAHLIEELRWRVPNLKACGFGGPEMDQVGCDLHFQMTDMAVMGVFRVLPLLSKFIKLAKQAETFFQEERPDAVVLVNFPGFNWHIAKRAKAAGIPVFFYLPPQLWAWGSWRIKRMRKYVDHVLCTLPFEHEWYTSRGVEAKYVGHPFFDEVAAKVLDDAFLKEHQNPEGKIVGLLPGSRSMEIKHNWPLMIKAAHAVSQKHPNARFLVAGYKQKFVETCQEMLATSGLEFPIEFFVGKTSEIIELADCCLMVSGSVSLEILARQTPSAVMYRVDWLASIVKWLVYKAKYISLPNYMADRMVLPEWIVTGNPKTAIQQMANTVDGWLSNPLQLAAAKADLETLCETAIQTGANAHTADAILEALESQPVTTPNRRAA